MNVVEAALRRVAGDLGSRQVAWAVVGGFAVSARADARFTRDVDVAVLTGNDHDAESLVHDLTARGYAIETLIEHDVTDRLATVRLRAPDPLPVIVDLLFASSGIEDEVVRTAELLEILPGLRVPVASVAALLVTKLLARDDVTRPQDAADLRALRAIATPDDLDEAHRLVALVKLRGYDRGRDLQALLEEYEAG